MKKFHLPIGKILPLFVTAAEADTDAKVIQCHESGVVLAACSKWELDVPTTFQWMPGGVHTINARYDGKPIQLTVAADANTAKVVQASFEQWTKVRPKQNPFGCVEHKEQEAALRLPKDVAAFEWKTDPEPGVYCTAVPTADGAKLVNGGMFSSWSPSFSTDAEYEKAKEIKGCMVFPKGVRGSKENPAKVLGCGFSVGSLTNKPAFRDISPVRASEMAALEEEALVEANDGIVTAAWSDEAREAALAARQKHNAGFSRAMDVMRAHEDSRDAYTATIKAHTEPSHDTHRHAARMHERAANSHRDIGGKDHEDYAADHAKKAGVHHQQASRLGGKRPMHGASEKETTTLDTVYAGLTPKADAVKDIYAKFGQPVDPAQTIYDRLNAEANG